MLDHFMTSTGNLFAAKKTASNNAVEAVRPALVRLIERKCPDEVVSRITEEM